MKTRIFYLTCFLLLSLTFNVSLSAQEFYDDGYVNKLSFEEKLVYIRSIMVEGDERATMARSHQKIDKALQGFLDTEFMEKYKEIKLEAEILAATFKAHSPNLPPEEVARVKKAYTEIADEFNQLLVEIKNDFMDRKTMKLIQKHPQMYSNSLQFRLSELKDDYSQNFEKVVAQVTGSDMYSAVPLAAIFGLIKLAVDFTDYLATASYEARRVKEEHLNTYFLEPYRFKDWIEIEVSEGDIYNQAIQQNDDPIPYEDPVPMNPFEETMPADSSKIKNNY